MKSLRTHKANKIYPTGGKTWTLRPRSFTLDASITGETSKGLPNLLEALINKTKLKDEIGRQIDSILWLALE